MGKLSYELGLKGEEIAAKYLSQKGFRILEQNFRSQQGEVDIIAKDKNHLVFVEVKYYSFRSFTAPVHAVRKTKREAVIHAARCYLYQNKLQDQLCRFDVVAIYRKFSGQTVIDHLENAFGVY